MTNCRRQHYESERAREREQRERERGGGALSRKGGGEEEVGVEGRGLNL